MTQTGPAKENRFQGRYIVMKPFNQSQCYRYWGGGMRGSGFTPAVTALSGTGGNQASDAKLTAPFESYLKSDIPELGLTKKPNQKKK